MTQEFSKKRDQLAAMGNEQMGQRPDLKKMLVGLSVSVYFNMPLFKTQLEAVRSDFSKVDIFVGGQAFNWGGINMLKNYAATHYIPSLGVLETEISK